MTQKELLYVEDAIGHENSVIAYLEDAKDGLEDNSLVDYVVKEIRKHENMREKLIDLLGECQDE
jgi:hypothetical protein